MFGFHGNKATLLITALLAAAVFTSCGDDEKIVEVPVPCASCIPEAPRDVEVWNRDGYVRIWWYHPDTTYSIDKYMVYQSDQPYSNFIVVDSLDASAYEPFDWIFFDLAEDNGNWYYYAVSAVNYDRIESDLSYEVVTGTPRPEGFLRLYDSNFLADSSGYDFSSESNEAQWDTLNSTDIYFSIDSSTPEFLSGHDGVRFQSHGYIEYFDTIHSAPEYGWTSTSGRMEAVAEHCYTLRIIDGSQTHYAKLYVWDITPTYVEFWWAYQTDPGNRDLAPGPSASIDEKGAARLTSKTGGYTNYSSTTWAREGRQIPPLLREGNKGIYATTEYLSISWHL